MKTLHLSAIAATAALALSACDNTPQRTTDALNAPNSSPTPAMTPGMGANNPPSVPPAGGMNTTPSATPMMTPGTGTTTP